jgi:CDP-diacylglycerol--glycerol-3-phosphate 3-phosphatidyltransferase/cardiolipin synthase
MTWATRITILRIILIPVFVGLLLYYDRSARRGAADDAFRYWALAVFVIAALSDALDGYLARHHGQASELGALLDPIADKLMMLAALVCLGFMRTGPVEIMPLWFPIIIIGRDAILVLGFFLLMYFQVPFKVRPHWTGKAATFFTFLAIGATLLNWEVGWAFCVLGGLGAMACLAIYLRAGIAAFRDAGHTAPRTAIPDKTR